MGDSCYDLGFTLMHHISSFTSYHLGLRNLLLQILISISLVIFHRGSFWEKPNKSYTFNFVAFWENDNLLHLKSFIFPSSGFILACAILLIGNWIRTWNPCTSCCCLYRCTMCCFAPMPL